MAQPRFIVRSLRAGARAFLVNLPMLALINVASFGLLFLPAKFFETVSFPR